MPRYSAPARAGRFARQQGHPVIGALPERLDPIAERGDFKPGKLVGEAFGFLQAQDVGLGVFEKGEQMRQAHLDRIDVPAGNFHRHLTNRNTLAAATPIYPPDLLHLMYQVRIRWNSPLS